MLCSRFKQILFTKTTLNNNVQFRCFINARFISKGCGFEGFWASLIRNRKELIRMNSVRYIFRVRSVNRFWNVWTRSVNIVNVVKRCRKDRGVREVIHCFRQAFMRPRRTLLLSATAAFKVNAEVEEKRKKPPKCSRNITDADLEALLLDFDRAIELTRKTLYCAKCNERLVIDKKLPGVKYCVCKDSQPAGPSEEGWQPYMEADDVIIWRKQYKPGQGLYAYKVYGRYKDVQAQDFAAVQVDGAYRRAWDAAVASLSVVERSANGLPDQAVLHWEVLWPRLFANRDYVYIRRHKEYDVASITSPPLFPDTSTSPPSTPTSSPTSPSSSTISPSLSATSPPSSPTPPPSSQTPPRSSPTSTPSSPPSRPSSPPRTSRPSSPPPPPPPERPSVHSKAKKKALEAYSHADPLDTTPLPKDPIDPTDKNNKVYVIVSRSCTHPSVPATKNAIRVTEYWSHMLVRTIDGPDKVGMEFVLTYYDEPAVGGLPSGVASWATGRAAPAYLDKMRVAAKAYTDYRKVHHQDIPDFTPFRPEKVSYDEEDEDEDSKIPCEEVNEAEMESSKTGPEMEPLEAETREDKATQTEDPPGGPEVNVKVKVIGNVIAKDTEDKAVSTVDSQSTNKAEKEEKIEEEEAEEDTNGGWIRYFYPLYYFV